MMEQGFYVRGWLVAWKVVQLKPAKQTVGYGPGGSIEHEWTLGAVCLT